jgi:hypothetical protein
VPPNTFAGNCYPHTGSGYAGTVLYNTPYPEYREYISTQLNEAMIPGNTYTVSFWITNGAPPISPYIIKNIGVHLSSAPLTQNGWNPIYITPTWENTNYSGSQTWVQYSFTVNPMASWQYITLGSFRSDTANAPVSTYTGTSGPPSVYAYYFWDDIRVLAPSVTGIDELSAKAGSLLLYPSPASNEINISAPESIDEIVLYNYAGEEAAIIAIHKTGLINTKDLARGIYYMVALSKKQAVTSKKIILE